jgi:transcriptional regulator with XRE-family HTH domain
LPVAVGDQEDDIDQQPYLWSDLLARRNALALRREDLIPVLRVEEQKYRARETGALSVGPYLVEELIAMEEFVADVAATMLAAAPSAGTAVLQAVIDQDEFAVAYPQARTLRDSVVYPLALQHVAVGRAAGELSRRGLDVEVHRAGRRADLTVRRLAAGLEKNETAALLGVEKKHYYTWERGKPPSAGLLTELQAVDDFITTNAAQLDVTEVDEVIMVLMLDDQRQFEQAYPLARTMRDGVPYPIRVHRVAAALRAHQLDAAGRPARIAVIAN